MKLYDQDGELLPEDGDEDAEEAYYMKHRANGGSHTRMDEYLYCCDMRRQAMARLNWKKHHHSDENECMIMDDGSVMSDEQYAMAEEGYDFYDNGDAYDMYDPDGFGKD